VYRVDRRESLSVLRSLLVQIERALLGAPMPVLGLVGTHLDLLSTDGALPVHQAPEKRSGKPVPHGRARPGILGSSGSDSESEATPTPDTIEPVSEEEANVFARDLGCSFSARVSSATGLNVTSAVMDTVRLVEQRFIAGDAVMNMVPPLLPEGVSMSSIPMGRGTSSTNLDARLQPVPSYLGLFSKDLRRTEKPSWFRNPFGSSDSLHPSSPTSLVSDPLCFCLRCCSSPTSKRTSAKLPSVRSVRSVVAAMSRSQMHLAGPTATSLSTGSLATRAIDSAMCAAKLFDSSAVNAAAMQLVEDTRPTCWWAIANIFAPCCLANAWCYLFGFRASCHRREALKHLASPSSLARLPSSFVPEVSDGRPECAACVDSCESPSRFPIANPTEVAALAFEYVKSFAPPSPAGRESLSSPLLEHSSLNRSNASLTVWEVPPPGRPRKPSSESSEAEVQQTLLLSTDARTMARSDDEMFVSPLDSPLRGRTDRGRERKMLDMLRHGAGGVMGGNEAGCDKMCSCGSAVAMFSIVAVCLITGIISLLISTMLLLYRPCGLPPDPLPSEWTFLTLFLLQSVIVPILLSVGACCRAPNSVAYARAISSWTLIVGIVVAIGALGFDPSFAEPHGNAGGCAPGSVVNDDDATPTPSDPASQGLQMLGIGVRDSLLVACCFHAFSCLCVVLATGLLMPSWRQASTLVQAFSGIVKAAAALKVPVAPGALLGASATTGRHLTDDALDWTGDAWAGTGGDHSPTRGGAPAAAAAAAGTQISMPLLSH
jgi:hypothetical protein